MFNSTLKRAQLGSGLLHLTRLCLLLLLTFTLSAVTADAQSDKDIHPLELHKPVERVLAGGLSHSYRVVLAAGQYLRVVADQRGIDVVVTLFDPDNKPVVEIDSPNGTQGPEPLSAIAETSGAYRLEVRSLEKDAPAGRYEVKLDELRTATEKDRGRIAAQQTLIDAERLFQEGTAESLRSAIGKYEESLSLFRSVEEHAREPEILNSIGILYKTLGDTRKALDYYMRALPLFRKAGDSNGEAVLLQNIGRVYFDLGERQKALDFYGQALPLLRKAGDRANEAMTLNGIALVYSSSGEMHKALDQYEQSLQLTRALNDGASEAGRRSRSRSRPDRSST